MTWWAAFLFHRSRERSDGSRGVLAQAAWRRLAKAGERGDPNAFQGVWNAWRADKTRALPANVSRWPVPEGLAFLPGWTLVTREDLGSNREVVAKAVAASPKAITAAWEACSFDPECPLPDELIRLPVPDRAWGALIATATDVRRDIRERTVIGKLVPDRKQAEWGSVRLAEFFLLTGQIARLRALDDPASALAQVYESTGEQTRTALRAAVAGTGELDLLAAVGGPWGVTAPDGDAHVRALVDRECWPQLWDLATRLPLPDAVAVARQLAVRWQPPETNSRLLLNLLSQADPNALAAPTPVRLRTDAEPRSCSFSMDGRWAVVTVLSSGRAVAFGHTPSGHDLSAGEDLTVDWLLFRMPDGTLVERTRRAGVLYDARLADRWENRGHRPAVAVDGRVFGLHDPGEEQRYPAVAQQMILPYPGGFVREDVLLPGRGVPPPYQGGLPHDGMLTFFDSTGQVLRRVRFHQELGLPDRWHYGLLAVDPRSGRVLVYSGERVWLLDHQARSVLASSPPDTFVDSAAFLDPDRLAMTGSVAGGAQGRCLRIWRRRGDTIETDDETPQPRNLYTPVVFPDQGRIVGVNGEERLRWYDARTLTEIGTPAGQTASALWDSPGGRLLACTASDGGGVDVFLDPYLNALANRALADMTPADLAAVTEALHAAAPVGTNGALPFLALLHDCLELRFGPGPGHGTDGVQRS